MPLAASPLEIIALIVSILFAMTVHEAAHAYVGLKLGDTTAAEQGRISLNPLHHIDPFATIILPILTVLFFGVPILAAKPVPFNPERVKFDEFGSAMIAFAGPLSNLLLAVIGAGLLRLTTAMPLVSALYIFVMLNVALAVFNLVPLPPLDGSRVLFAFAPEAVQQVMAWLEPYGIVVIFALVLFTGFGDILINLDHLLLAWLL